MIKRLPWLRNLKKTDIDPPLRLPIAAGSITNGEGWWPDTKRKRLIRKLVMERADQVARREGVDRREFMASSCGMATTLFMINLVNGCGGNDKTGLVGNMSGGGRDSGMGGGRDSSMGMPMDIRHACPASRCKNGTLDSAC